MGMPALQIQTPRVFIPLLQPARYKGAHGGRGSGKSHFFAEYVVEKHLMRKTNTVCIREVQKSLDQSVKKLIENKIESLGCGRHFNILRTHIEDRHGGRIIFQGMQDHTADSVKSLEDYDTAWGEEAQSLSERSLTLLRPTLRKPGSELLFSWNPNTPKDPIDKLLRGEEKPPRSIVVEANYMHNPWFRNTELYEEMLYDRRRDPDKYQWVWLGGYQRNSEARVFRNWRIDTFETPSNARFYFGADWGFSVDPSVLVRMYIEGRTIYIDHEAYKVGCEIDETPALFAGTDKQKPERWKNTKGHLGIPGATEWPIIGDSARPETISYMKRHGFPKMKPAKKGAGSVEDGVEFMKSYDIVVHPRCTHVIDELTMYSWKIDKQTQEILPVLDDKKNHTIDACRYAVENLRRGNYGMLNVV